MRYVVAGLCGLIVLLVVLTLLMRSRGSGPGQPQPKASGPGPPGSGPGGCTSSAGRKPARPSPARPTAGLGGPNGPGDPPGRGRTPGRRLGWPRRGWSRRAGAPGATTGGWPAAGGWQGGSLGEIAHSSGAPYRPIMTPAPKAAQTAKTAASPGAALGARAGARAHDRAAPGGGEQRPPAGSGSWHPGARGHGGVARRGTDSLPPAPFDFTTSPDPDFPPRPAVSRPTPPSRASPAARTFRPARTSASPRPRCPSTTRRPRPLTSPCRRAPRASSSAPTSTRPGSPPRPTGTARLWPPIPVYIWDLAATDVFPAAPRRPTQEAPGAVPEDDDPGASAANRRDSRRRRRRRPARPGSVPAEFSPASSDDGKQPVATPPACRPSPPGRIRRTAGLLVLACALCGIEADPATRPPCAPTGRLQFVDGVSRRSGRHRRRGAGNARSAPRAQVWTSPAVDGQIYGEPLVYAGRVYVATENDTVYALSAATGAVVWSAHLGRPVPAASLPCGDITPTVGITGTPVIDAARGEIFVVADELADGRPAHRLVGLSTTSGTVRMSQEVDPPGADPAALLQRTGLTLDAGQVVFGFGGNYGDCASYRGRVVAVPETGRDAAGLHRRRRAR